MGKKQKCNNCSKNHYSTASQLKCMRRMLKSTSEYQKESQTKKDVETDEENDQVSLEIDKVYFQISEKKRQYNKFYKQYLRKGVCDEPQYQGLEEKQQIKKDKESIKSIFKELMEIQQFTKEKRKDSKKRNQTQISKQQKLNRYLRQNADRIQTFEQLLHKSALNQWDWQQKRQKISSVDLSQSQARSSHRQLRGKDRQSIKTKYVVAWKILTDPLTRVMLSDQFLQMWHDKIFPQYINPFKFRRLEKEFKIEKKFNENQKAEVFQNEKYLKLCQKFNELSKQLIELKVCPIPPSLKTNAQKLIKFKEMTVQKVLQRIQQIQYEAESPQLIILPPENAPEPDYLTYSKLIKRKQQEERIQRIKEMKEAQQHKQWLNEMKKDRLTQNLTKFGGHLGFLVHASEANNEDLREILEIDYQNRKLAQQCVRSSIKIGDLDVLSCQENTISAMKKIKKELSTRLHPKPSILSQQQRKLERKRNNQMFRRLNRRHQLQRLTKRTL